MAAGYKAKEGEVNKNASQEEIWHRLRAFLSGKAKFTTTYKFALLRSILDNLFNVDDELILRYNTIFLTFSEIYWKAVVKYNLKQIKGGNSSAENIINRVRKEINLIDGDIRFLALQPDLQIKICREMIENCKKYVLGALYSDLDGTLYGFNNKDNKLWFSKESYDFLCKYKTVIEKLNNIGWIEFLEIVNKEEDSTKLFGKISNITKQEVRINLSKYREFLDGNEQGGTCFYCGKALTKNVAVEVDHFVPWSFIRDDKLWNLVPTCKECNRGKSDTLPHDKFIEKINSRNSKIVDKIQKVNELEQKFYVNEFKGYDNNRKKWLEVVDVSSDFKKYDNGIIRRVFEMAVKNGFDSGWEPKTYYKVF